VNTSPPSANSPAQVRGQLIGQENGIPVLRIDELTYLPKLAGSTPCRTTQASASSSPAAGQIFGGRKRKFDDAAGDATDYSAEAGPSPSKRARGHAGLNTLLHKLQIAAAETSPSPPPAYPPSPTPSAVTSVPAPLQVHATTRSASKRAA